MKFKRLLIISMICLLVFPLGARADFTTDSNAIEKAAQSVLMLACSNKDGSISTGSGFVAFNSQTLVTNCHVMDEAKEIVASDDNGNLYVIDRVYCVSEHMDIAILGFAAPTALRPLPLSTGDDLQRGQPVVTIGSPEGLKNTVSTGVVSSLAEYGGVPEIQISAPISHGSSGGALFDANGHVVGVTSSGLAEGQNLNFAVRSSVPLALYAAWKGETYTFNNWPKESPMDFNAGEKLAASAAPAAAQVQGDWLCPQCGQMNSHNFCQYCGAAKPQWQCACGQWSVSKFCGICGKNQETLLNDLNAALTLMDQGEFEKAAAALETLGDYNCGGFSSQAGINIAAEEQRRACYYQWGLRLEAAREYAAASEKYMASGAYADAPQRILEMAYLDAEKAFKEGAYLTAAELYLALGDYKDSADKAVESSYQIGLKLLAEGDAESALEVFTVLADYKDSAERIKESHYVRGEHFFSEGDHVNALAAFEQAGDFKDAATRIAQNHYGLAVNYMEKGEYLAAAGELKRATAYEGTAEKTRELFILRIQDQIQKGNFESAISLKSQAVAAGYAIDDLPMLEINQSNAGTAYLLKAASNMGFLVLSYTGDTYHEEYLSGIIAMEQTLGLVPDGIVYLSEYGSLCQAMYPGNKQYNIQHEKVLNKLCDLGYISLNYSERRLYSDKHKKGIRKAEEALNLTVDGTLTSAEQEVILAQNVAPPQPVKSLKVTTKKDYGSTNATLSWPKVKDAAYYSIYKNGEFYAKTADTKFSFNVYTAYDEGTFSVLAEKYTVSAEKHSPAKQVKKKK